MHCHGLGGLIVKGTRSFKTSSKLIDLADCNLELCAFDAPFGLHFQALKCSPSGLKHPCFLFSACSLSKTNLKTWEHHLDHRIHLEYQSRLRDGRPLRDGAPVPYGNSGTARELRYRTGWSGMVRDGPRWSRQSHTYGFKLSYYLVTSGFC